MAPTLTYVNKVMIIELPNNQTELRAFVGFILFIIVHHIYYIF